MKTFPSDELFSDLFVTEVRIDKKIPSQNYLSELPVIKYLRKMESIKFNSSVTFFVGENGTGKSTLIEGIAVALGFNPEGGSKNFNFSTHNSHSDLSDYLTVCKGIKLPRDGFFLRAESYYNFASNIDDLDTDEPRAETMSSPKIINSYGGVSLHKQSHGESFLCMVENRLGGKGIYIFDEPEAALSPARLLELMCHIDRLVKNDSQFIIATHSPILMAFPNAEIYELSEVGIRNVDYLETEHFMITKSFLNNPQKFLKEMFREDDD